MHPEVADFNDPRERRLPNSRRRRLTWPPRHTPRDMPFSWTGCHVDVDLGHSDADPANKNFGLPINSGFDLSSSVVGGTAGRYYQVSNWFGVENDVRGPMLAAARSILLRSTRPRRARPRRTGLTRCADASAWRGTRPCSTAPAAPPSRTRRLGRRRHRISAWDHVTLKLEYLPHSERQWGINIWHGQDRRNARRGVCTSSLAARQRTLGVFSSCRINARTGTLSGDH
jgi:hypothetical protein